MLSAGTENAAIAHADALELCLAEAINSPRRVQTSAAPARYPRARARTKCKLSMQLRALP